MKFAERNGSFMHLILKELVFFEFSYLISRFLWSYCTKIKLSCLMQFGCKLLICLLFIYSRLKQSCFRFHFIFFQDLSIWSILETYISWWRNLPKGHHLVNFFCLIILLFKNYFFLLDIFLILNIFSHFQKLNFSEQQNFLVLSLFNCF